MRRRKASYEQAVPDWKGLPEVGCSNSQRRDLASRWQQWAVSVHHGCLDMSPLPVQVSAYRPDRRQPGNWRWSKAWPPVQATLSTRRHHTYMNEMLYVSQTHPLLTVAQSCCGAAVSLSPWLLEDSKVNNQSKPEHHESVYNIRCMTVMDFELIFGYSRYKATGTTSHAWVSWAPSFEWWQIQMAVDFYATSAVIKVL